MNIPSNLPRLKGLRHPREVISYAVWAYHRFALSTADVEDLLAERGVNISREAVRLWVNHLGAKFGPSQVAITDKLRSDIKPISHIAPDVDYRRNNAIEVSHRPTRKREKIFGRFKSQRQA